MLTKWLVLLSFLLVVPTWLICFYTFLKRVIYRRFFLLWEKIICWFFNVLIRLLSTLFSSIFGKGLYHYPGDSLESNLRHQEWQAKNQKSSRLSGMWTFKSLNQVCLEMDLVYDTCMTYPFLNYVKFCLHISHLENCWNLAFPYLVKFSNRQWVWLEISDLLKTSMKWERTKVNPIRHIKAFSHKHCHQLKLRN